MGCVHMIGHKAVTCNLADLRRRSSFERACDGEGILM